MKKTFTSVLALTVGTVIPSIAIPQNSQLPAGLTDEIRPSVAVPSLTTIRLETIRSRDEDLLRTLAAALQVRHGQLLEGTKILFTRVESHGTVFYRMDIQGIEDERNARRICEILEMERCLVARPGASALAGAEVRGLPVGNDGLLDIVSAPAAIGPYSPDEPVSGSLEMSPLPTREQASSSWDSIDNLGHLPMSRPAPDAVAQVAEEMIEEATGDDVEVDVVVVTDEAEAQATVEVSQGGPDTVRPIARPDAQELAQEQAEEMIGDEQEPVMSAEQVGVDTDLSEENAQDEGAQDEGMADEGVGAIITTMDNVADALSDRMPEVSVEDMATQARDVRREKIVEDMLFLRDVLSDPVAAPEPVEDLEDMPQLDAPVEEETIPVEESRAPANSIDEVVSVAGASMPALDLTPRARLVTNETAQAQPEMTIALIDPMSNAAVVAPVRGEAEMGELIVSALAEPLRPVFRATVLAQLPARAGDDVNEAVAAAVTDVVGETIAQAADLGRPSVRPMMRPAGLQVPADEQTQVAQVQEDSVEPEAEPGREIGGRPVIGAREALPVVAGGGVTPTASLGETRPGRQAQEASRVDAEPAALAFSLPATTVESNPDRARRPIAFIAPTPEVLAQASQPGVKPLSALPLARPAQTAQASRLSMIREALAAERSEVQQAREAAIEEARQARAQMLAHAQSEAAEQAQVRDVATSGRLIERPQVEQAPKEVEVEVVVAQADENTVRPRMRPESFAQYQTQDSEPDVAVAEVENEPVEDGVRVALDARWAAAARAQLPDQPSVPAAFEVAASAVETVEADRVIEAQAEELAEKTNADLIDQVAADKTGPVVVDLGTSSLEARPDRLSRERLAEATDDVAPDVASINRADRAAEARVSDVAEKAAQDVADNVRAQPAPQVMAELKGPSLEAPAFWLPSPRPAKAGFVIPDIEFPMAVTLASSVSPLALEAVGAVNDMPISNAVTVSAPVPDVTGAERVVGVPSWAQEAQSVLVSEVQAQELVVETLARVSGERAQSVTVNRVSQPVTLASVAAPANEVETVREVAAQASRPVNQAEKVMVGAAGSDEAVVAVASQTPMVPASRSQAVRALKGTTAIVPMGRAEALAALVSQVEQARAVDMPTSVAQASVSSAAPAVVERAVAQVGQSVDQVVKVEQASAVDMPVSVARAYRPSVATPVVGKEVAQARTVEAVTTMAEAPGEDAQVLTAVDVSGPMFPMIRPAMRTMVAAAADGEITAPVQEEEIQQEGQQSDESLGAMLAALSSGETPVAASQEVQAAVAQEAVQEEIAVEVAGLRPMIRPSREAVETAPSIDPIQVKVEPAPVLTAQVREDRYRPDIVAQMGEDRPVDEFLATFDVRMPLTAEELEAGQQMLAMGDMTIPETVVLLASGTPAAPALEQGEQADFETKSASPRSVLMLDEFITALASDDVNFVMPAAIDLNRFQSSPEAREMLAQANQDAVDAALNEDLPETIEAEVTAEGVEMRTADRRVVVSRTARPLSRFAVALNDTYALPFDLSGSGRLPLQQMPSMRPQVVSAGEQVSTVALLARVPEIELPEEDFSRFFPEDPLQAVDQMVTAPSAEIAAQAGSLDGVDIRESVALSVDVLRQDEAGLLSPPRPTLDNRPQAAAPVISDQFETGAPVPQLEEAPAELTRQAAPAVEEEAPLIGNGAYAEHDLRVDGQQRTSIMDRDTRRVSNTPDENMMIRLSYATSIEEASAKVKDLMRYFPQAMLDKGRFFGQAAPASPDLYVIGLQAHNPNDFRDLVEYMEVNGIVHVLPGQSARPLLNDPLVFNQ